MDSLVTWFQSHGGVLDVSAMGLTEFPGSGRGAVALQDVPYPCPLTLSTRTSDLPSLLGTQLWKTNNLGKGWVGLILCMMREEAQGERSKWSEYLSSLPDTFDTPMFWSEDDLAELRGTAVVEKIGKDEAEKDYLEKLLPTVHARPDLFPPETISTYYTLERFHIMGSRILSRSFQVENSESRTNDDEDEVENEANTSTGSAMDVDGPPPPDANEVGEDGEQEGTEAEGDEEDDEEADSGDISMVPMADMLNARYGSENAKLFYEEADLKMVTTKPIKSGSQIWNTYGDLPNSDLFRRYGHVDLFPLPNGGQGNPADVVEIRADLVEDAVSSVTQALDPDAKKERIDWWLEEGGDDTFVIEADCTLPELFVVFVRVLLLSSEEWERTKSKSKLPKPKMDAIIASVAITVLTKRLEQYPTSIEEDETLLSAENSLSTNKRHAIFVRLGEKRLLRGSLDKLKGLLSERGGGEKRKASGSTSKDSRGKKAKR
ncbi:hypothetical protein JAAARDRAFT_59753 [Jaapia argillacea MUCL 33604]|uniref:Ribosomal lysine N-methyltransferase 4 n=1 Tax=Jaapia argillacea MUCL 33604 TaxID=933084 RepID=A0A067PZL5_9AGAM|nr:hypothetical protein JAAARDRAFT_59753 [Jaapia argillacea MUCL 33604]